PSIPATIFTHHQRDMPPWLMPYRYPYLGTLSRDQQAACRLLLPLTTFHRTAPCRLVRLGLRSRQRFLPLCVTPGFRQLTASSTPSGWKSSRLTPPCSQPGAKPVIRSAITVSRT